MTPLEQPFTIIEKIYGLIDQILINYITPNIKLNNVSDIDLELVKKLKS